MGTKFIATRESMAPNGYKQMLVDSTADDVLLTTAFTGLQTNMLKPSIILAGLDPDNLPSQAEIDLGSIAGPEGRKKRWRDIWSAGHSISGIREVLSVQQLVTRTASEYEAARELGAKGSGRYRR
jgi:nitronate monooxygenase